MLQLREIRAHSTFILVSCCLAVFTDIFFYGILPPILPYVLVERAHVPSNQLQTWVAVIPALYCASLVLASPPAGYASDNMPRRRPLFLGAVLFQLTGVVLLMVGSSIALWVAGVVVAGCSSAIVWASSLALVLDSTSESRIGQSMGYVGMSLGFGIMLGPVLGGVLYDMGGNYAPWGLCLGLIGVDVLLRVVMIEPRESAARITQPPRIACEQVTVSLEKENPKQGTTTAGPMAAGQESCSDESQPMAVEVKQRPAIFTLSRSPRFVFALFATLCLTIAVTSLDAVMPIYLKEIFNFSALSTGLMYFALTISNFIQPLAGSYIDRRGGRLIGTLGFMLAVPTFTCLRYVDHNSLNQKILLAALLVLIGASAAIVLPVLMFEVSCVVLEHEKINPGLWGQKGAFAQAHSLWSAAYAVGCTLGPIWGGEIQKAAGWQTENWTVAILCGVAAVLTPIFVGVGPARQP